MESALCLDTDVEGRAENAENSVDHESHSRYAPQNEHRCAVSALNPIFLLHIRFVLVWRSLLEVTLSMP
jgi:hypothetical protein